LEPPGLEPLPGDRLLPGDGLLVGEGLGDGVAVGDGLVPGDGPPADGELAAGDGLRRASLTLFMCAAACICCRLSQLQLLIDQPGRPPAPTRQPSHRFPGQPE
jgi:hypothetical protein